jgi:perosamine synthetase
LPTQLLTKNQLAQTYSAQLDGQKYTVPIQSEGTAHAWQTYHLLVKGNRNELIQVLKNKGIGTNYGAQCMPAMNFYVNKYKLNSEKLFPAAWASYNQGLALPLFSTLTTEQQQTVIQHLNNEK